MTRRNALVMIVFVVTVSALMMLTAFAYNAQASEPQGQRVEFNGQALDVDGNSTIMVQSSEHTQAWGASESGGPITVTTSIVTVTVWSKP